MAYIPGSYNKASTGYVPGSTGGKVGGYVPGANRTAVKGYQPGVRRSSTSDLVTSDGLYTLASQSGLKDRADSLLKNQQGEQTKKIFSGGFISDVFDVLGALQYGTVGLLQGKTFSEGVQTRSSFTDDFKDKGIAGMVAGIALDIAFDPLTYIAPATIVKKIPLLSKALKGGKDLVFGKRVTQAIEGTDKTYEAVQGGTKIGKYFADKFNYMNGADPVFRESYERSIKNIGVSSQALVSMGKTIAKMQPDTAAKILEQDEAGRFIRRKLSDITDLADDELEAVTNFYTTIDDLGRQAVDLKLLTKETYEENIGQYIKNAYEEYETAKKSGFFGVGKVGIKGIKSRKDVENVAEFGLKQIENPAYLLFKTALDLTKDVENAKLFKAVNERFGTEVAQEGFKKLPVGPRLGELSGKYVPNNMAEYLDEIIQPQTENLGTKAVAAFKFAKVIMNPGTHARNIISNKVLNYWKLGMNPLDPRTMIAEKEALTEVLKGTGKWSDEARPLGYSLDTFASAEMKSLLDDPQMAAFGSKLGKAWGGIKKKLGDIYQGEENQAKLTAYIFNRKFRKLNPEEAWKAAESATFNYAQVTPFIRKVRQSLFGLPFVTFTVKATPAALETIYKNPRRVSVIGKIKQGIESRSDLKETDRERASEPPWVRDGFFIKLPIKDKKGRSAYFDLTYILPFGDLVSGTMFERGVDLDTGAPRSVPETGLNKVPFFNFLKEVGTNEDFYGNKIWKDSDPVEKQLLDFNRHLTKTVAPPLVGDLIGGGYDKEGKRKERGIRGAIENQDEENQQRTVMQELLRMVGAKIQPIDADIQDTLSEWNKKKALQTLLLENGIIKTFERPYVPKTE